MHGIAGFGQKVLHCAERADECAEELAEKDDCSCENKSHCNLEHGHAARKAVVGQISGQRLKSSHRAVSLRVCRIFRRDYSCEENDECSQNTPLKEIFRPVFDDC